MENWQHDLEQSRWAARKGKQPAPAEQNDAQKRPIVQEVELMIMKAIDIHVDSELDLIVIQFPVKRPGSSLESADKSRRISSESCSMANQAETEQQHMVAFTASMRRHHKIWSEKGRIQYWEQRLNKSRNKKHRQQ